MGLCWTCYYTPGVRDQYQTQSKFGVRGVGGQNHRKPTMPTSVLPGTTEKVAVMAERAKRGEHLFHPEDATCETCSTYSSASRDAAGSS